MAFNVRIFGYSGIAQVPSRFVRQFNADSVFVREEPYLWSQVVTTNGASAVESVVQAADAAAVIWIEVPDGQAIRYEINPQGPGGSTHRNAGNGSPIFSGRDAFFWYQGATISIVEAASYP